MYWGLPQALFVFTPHHPDWPGSREKNMQTKTVAVLGCGSLGSLVAEGIAKNLADSWKLSGVCARTFAHAQELAQRTGCRAWPDVEAMLTDRPDMVVEAAGVAAAKEHAEKILSAGSSLILLSCGALADEDFVERLKNAAQKGGSVLHVPSGAIGGYDLLRTLAFRQRQLGVKGEEAALKVQVDNFKNPTSLAGAPGLAGFSPSSLADKREQVFAGSAREAIKGFPKNVNVAVGAAVASAGIDETRVTITSDPSLVENVHKVTAEGFGVRATMEFGSMPDPENPRSSTMTAWSVLALLQDMASPVRYF